MNSYGDAYKSLNDAQRHAVDTIFGPLLVIAGPGTGKTQLLAVRVAHILQKTDALPQNILCLTFTESGQRAMRERLQRFIGQAAYHVTISTYHAFGSDLLRRYPEYVDNPGQRPVDELIQDQTLRAVLDSTPFSNPLKSADLYLKDIRSTISDAKRALLTPRDVAKIAEITIETIQNTSPICRQELQSFSKISKSVVPIFERLCEALLTFAPTGTLPPSLTPISFMAGTELKTALDIVAETGKTNALTKWKNVWLVRDSHGDYQLAGMKSAKRLLALADIYDRYESLLAENNYFDYDDMILRAIKTLESNDDLRFTLQEQYQYILLDEFQDTNGAQLRLIELLTDNPIHEGKPNIMAVGDDDQAIYAFQGASQSNMQQFIKNYQDVTVVSLTENYRSHAKVLHVSHAIANQIESRLHHQIDGLQKLLMAANPHIQNKASIERHEFLSDAAELHWIAKRIEKLVNDGMQPSSIAVLAPKHKYLEPLVPFLNERGIASAYEKRENILDDPIIERLTTMTKLVMALHENNNFLADELWATVLSYDFWNLSTADIWQLSWTADKKREPWTSIMMTDSKLKPIALFFIRLSHIAAEETLETMFDYLIGVSMLELPGEQDSYASPFFEFYFGTAARAQTQSFWHALSILTILREKLRDYMTEDGIPKLRDFVTFVTAHRQAGIKIINSTPYRQSDEAVQIMTAFKSKGLEFDAVFVLACQDDVWGTLSRSNNSKISLPANLRHIRYAGATNDERLRLFYVALTRARQHLYITSYAQTFASRPTPRLSYLDELDDGLGGLTSNAIQGLTGTIHNEIPDSDTRLNELQHYWSDRHISGLKQPELRALLGNRLQSYQLSATHVNSFTDTRYGGPEHVLLNTILRFPKAPGMLGQYGNAIHETMQWIHIQNRQNGTFPSLEKIIETFSERLRGKRLTQQQTKILTERGEAALRIFIPERIDTFSSKDEHEFDFRQEGVLIGQAHMTGKIDKLAIDKENRRITVIDYKTGSGYDSWKLSEPKLYKYRQQLIIYKLLIEGSHTFEGFTVDKGILEFVEPDENGKLMRLEYTYEPEEVAHTARLVQAIWNHIMALDLPDISDYQPSVAGIKLFEQYLLTHADELDTATTEQIIQPALQI